MDKIQKIHQEIERRLEKYDHNYTSAGSELKELISFINSLQQKQPKVELDADIEMQWDSFNKHVAEYGEESEDVVWLNWLSFVDVATHFYKLGRNTKKHS